MTNSATVSTGLATLGANGWVTNEGIAADRLDKTRSRNTVVILGHSRTSRAGLSCATAAGNVVGDGNTAVFTFASSPIMTGSRLNFAKGSPVTPFDGLILEATNININSFSVPSALVGNPPGAVAWNVQTRWQERGWWTWANAYMGGRMHLLNNAGIGGDTIEGCLARLDRDVIAYGPQWCVCEWAVNSLGSSQSVSGIMELARQGFARLIRYGIAPIAVTETPLHPSYSGTLTFAAATAKIQQYNYMLKAHCAQNGIICIDLFESTVETNPAVATDGRALVGAVQGTASDYIHESTYGCRLKGKKFASVMNALLPPVSVLTNSQADNYGANAANLNLLDNAPWTLTGGSASGTGVSGAAATPAGFSVTSSGATASTCVVTSAARTVASDGDAVGNNLILTMTAAGVETPTFTVTMSDATARMVAGNYYRYAFALELSGTAGSNLSKILSTMLVTYNGTGRGYISASETDQAPTVMPYEDGKLIMISPPFRVPAGQAINSGFAPIVSFTFSTGGTAVVAKIGRVTYPQIDD